jgi:hypothetical protein
VNRNFKNYILLSVTLLVAGCGPSASDYPLAKDFCEREGRRLTDEEKIVQVLFDLHKGKYKDDTFMGNSLRQNVDGKSVVPKDFTPLPLKQYIKDNSVDTSNDDTLRLAIGEFYKNNKDCCKFLDPYEIQYNVDHAEDIKQANNQLIEWGYFSDILIYPSRYLLSNCGKIKGIDRG